MKVDKNKIYALIGQIVVYSSIWAIAVRGTAWTLTRTIIY